MSDGTYETILWEQRGTVGWLTLNRPDRLNAFDLTMCNELADVWAKVRTDDSIHVVVLTASGEKAFCTGVDRDFIPSDGGLPHTDARSATTLDVSRPAQRSLALRPVGSLHRLSDTSVSKAPTVSLPPPPPQ